MFDPVIFILRTQLNEYSGYGLPFILERELGQLNAPLVDSILHFTYWVFFYYVMVFFFTMCILYDVPVTFLLAGFRVVHRYPHSFRIGESN